MTAAFEVARGIPHHHGLPAGRTRRGPIRAEVSRDRVAFDARARRRRTSGGKPSWQIRAALPVVDA